MFHTERTVKPRLCAHSLVSLCQKYSGDIKGSVLRMFVRFRDKAVTEEDISRTLVNTQADSGTHMETEALTHATQSIGSHVL